MEECAFVLMDENGKYRFVLKKSLSAVTPMVGIAGGKANLDTDELLELMTWAYNLGLEEVR